MRYVVSSVCKIKLSVASTMAALVAAYLAAGCNTAGCLDNRNSLPLAGIYSMATGEPVAVDSLAVWAVGAVGDSLLLSPRSAASQLYLPLRSEASSTAFCFAVETAGLFHPELFDTITVSYTSTPWFISEDCGAGYRYHINRLTHTSHLIDSVALLDSTVTNINAEVISIYYRTAEPDSSTTDTPA